MKAVNVFIISKRCRCEAPLERSCKACKAVLWTNTQHRCYWEGIRETF